MTLHSASINKSERSKYRILINATTLNVGGGIQVGISLIEFASQLKGSNLEFVFVVSKNLYYSLSSELQEDTRINYFETSPARIFKGRKTRKLIKNIERDFSPHVVYSIGFPSYIKFTKPEIGRYTNPWEINAPPLPWHTLALIDKIKIYLGIKYRLFWAKRAKLYETQTYSGQRGIAKKLKVSPNKIKVIPNSPNPIFLELSKSLNKINKEDKVTIFCLSAAYTHKNLIIIPKVALHLKQIYNLNCEFILTLPKDHDITSAILESCQKLKVDKLVKNVGPLKLTECLQWYEKCHIVFLPTLLEVFSATYLEAMAMSRPIVTTDLEFAHDNCGDAALYFDPLSPVSACEKIMVIINNYNVAESLVHNGKIKLSSYPGPVEKHNIIFNWLEEIASKNAIN